MAQFGSLRTVELRELLEDDDKVNQIIRYSQKFQKLKRATEGTLISNHRLAETTLSQKPSFKDAKLLLAMKYRELQKLVKNIQAKQDRLEDFQQKNSTLPAQLSLGTNIINTEEECEMLFKKFVEGKLPVEDFLEYFQESRKLYHIRLILLQKMEDIMKPTPKPPRPTETRTNTGDLWRGVLEEQPPTSHPLFPLMPSAMFPGSCPSSASAPIHLPFLPLFDNHVSIPPHVQLLPVHVGTNALLCARFYGRLPLWPIKPVRLKRLDVQPRKNLRKPH